MTGAAARIAILDDDAALADALARLLGQLGHEVQTHGHARQLLGALADFRPHCLLCDIRLGGGVNGFDLAARVKAAHPAVSMIFMTAWPTVSAAVDAVRTFGGLDYLEKPVDEERLLRAIDEGAAWSRKRRAADRRVRQLTRREREVFDLLAMGHPNKAIAEILGISAKTVEDHRAAIMEKTGVGGLARLISLNAWL